MESLVTLLTEDGQRVSIDLKSARQIGILKNLLALGNGTPTFPVPVVKSTILSIVIEYLEQHKEDSLLPSSRNVHEFIKTNKTSTSKPSDPFADSDQEESGENIENPDSDDSINEDYLEEEYLTTLTSWDQKFIESLDIPTLIELTKAANYLNIPNLLDLCCRSIARHMSGLKPEELRKKFNLPNDFTPEEEAKLKAEFAWIEE